MVRIYVNQPLMLGASPELDVATIRHLLALRLRVNSEIYLFNGTGVDYRTQIVEFTRKQVSLKIIEQHKIHTESPLAISLLMAVIAAERMDWVIQKATELGVHTVYPFYSTRVQRFSPEKEESRLLHWQRVSIAAAEQSGRSQLMQIKPPEDYAKLLHSVAGISHKIICSPAPVSAVVGLSEQMIVSCETPQKYVLAIGPEGGFSDTEVQLAISAGFIPQSLGPRILRAESAAISSITLLQYKYGDINPLSL